jgi:hypothetical protein
MRSRTNYSKIFKFDFILCLTTFVFSFSIAYSNNLSVELNSNISFYVSATQAGTGESSVFRGDKTSVLILIDSTILDNENLLNQWEILPNSKVRLIESRSMGLEAISRIVSEYTNLDTIHLVTHGREGVLHLGGQHFDLSNIILEKNMLKKISNALARDGELLFYGCDIGRGLEGEKFVRNISEIIQHNVAASTNQTGTPILGGDWVLERFARKLHYSALNPIGWNHLLSSNTTTAWTVGTNVAANTITVGSNSTVTNISFSGFTNATTTTAPLSSQSFNNLNVFNPAVQNSSSLVVQYNWDVVPEVATELASADGGSATMTINFSRAVKNPIMHLDRLGGSDGTLQNGMAFTLQTSGIVLSRLSGTSHFSVSGNVITNGQIGQPIAAGYSAESSLTANLGTAAGSIELIGVFTTVSFLLSPGTNATEGAGADAFEIGFTYDPIPVALPDYFNTYLNTNLYGNLYSNNGSGLDSDFNNDSMTLTLINGNTFTTGTAIPLPNGVLTILDATAGTFSFAPNSGYIGGQSFSYTMRDNNFGAANSAVQINIMQTTLTIQTVSLGGVGGFSYSGNNGWVLKTNNTLSPNLATSSTAEILSSPSTLTSITQSLPLGYVLVSIVCNGLGAGVATANTYTRTVALDVNATAIGNNVVCIFTNVKTPTFKLQKKTLGGHGGPFSFSQTNLNSTPPSITTTAINTFSPATVSPIDIASLGSKVTVTETPSPSYVMNNITCIDDNSSITGNVGNFATLVGSTLTIPAANVVAGADFRCEITNSLIPRVKVQVVTLGGVGGPFAFTQFNLNSNPTNISTTSANQAQPLSATEIAISSLSSAVQITEALTGSFALIWAGCTDENSTTTGNIGSFGSLAGNTLTIPSTNVLAGANITCVFKNVVPNPQLAITKTANSPVPVQLGQSISYTYTVTNIGNVLLSDVYIADSHNGYGLPPLPLNEILTTDIGLLGDSTDIVNDGHWDKLGPGDTIVFEASYVVVQADIDFLQ